MDAHKEFRSSVREFCEREVDLETARAMERDDATPPELIAKMAAAGFVGLVLPEEYGGIHELVVLADELSYASSADKCAVGEPCANEAAMAKLFATERAKAVCLSGMQVLGGYGYLPYFDMERHLRDALLGTVGAGTSQIQRNIIAKSMGFR